MKTLLEVGSPRPNPVICCLSPTVVPSKGTPIRCLPCQQCPKVRGQDCLIRLKTGMTAYRMSSSRRVVVFGRCSFQIMMPVLVPPRMWYRGNSTTPNGPWERLCWWSKGVKARKWRIGPAYPCFVRRFTSVGSRWLSSALGKRAAHMKRLAPVPGTCAVNRTKKGREPVKGGVSGTRFPLAGGVGGRGTKGYILHSHS